MFKVAEIIPTKDMFDSSRAIRGPVSNIFIGSISIAGLVGSVFVAGCVCRITVDGLVGRVTVVGFVGNIAAESISQGLIMVGRIAVVIDNGLEQCQRNGTRNEKRKS